MAITFWLWVALVAVLVLCCLPMRLMGRHKEDSRPTSKKDSADKSP